MERRTFVLVIALLFCTALAHGQSLDCGMFCRYVEPDSIRVLPIASQNPSQCTDVKELIDSYEKVIAIQEQQLKLLQESLDRTREMAGVSKKTKKQKIFSFIHDWGWAGLAAAGVAK